MDEREVVTISTMRYEELIRNNNIYQELMCKMVQMEYQLISLTGMIERLTKGETNNAQR